MEKIRAIIIGVVIWFFGVSAFTLSFFIPILHDAELQANLVLFLTVIPLVWFGTKIYFLKGAKTKGFWVGLTFFFIAALLDALITVPLLIIPNGGSHLEFYADPGFWCIGLLFIGVATLFGHLKKKRTTEFI
ncbi:DUF5367 family protein [Croceivirga thetidis]|uniref:DUF5367 domain-containing protein n=1 Tax=Croceivirga thetidis TaxID=2721623 RepID=A0ABX1GPF5_9FLAO|nr:DUF5367 family protein [Croceivirga thetidis]NKI31816.1 DUF5367 domain-containing protein [Croceivirga thetidis]